mgnify:CR=1 FL=1
MKYILSIITIVFTMFSCGSQCDNACTEWEECVQGYCDMFGCSYSCQAILRVYSGSFVGIKTVTNNNTLYTLDEKVYLTRFSEDTPNYMRIFLNWNSNIAPQNALSNNIYALFTNPAEIRDFNIPQSTKNDSVPHPITNIMTYTSITYKGSGSLNNGQLTLNYTFEAFGETNQVNFIGEFAGR